MTDIQEKARDALTAQKALKVEQDKITEHLNAINRLMKNLGKVDASRSDIHWGHVGDAAFIASSLAELVTRLESSLPDIYKPS